MSEKNVINLYADYLEGIANPKIVADYLKDAECSESLAIHIAKNNLINKEFMINQITLNALIRNTRYDQYRSFYQMLIDDSSGVIATTTVSQIWIVIDSFEWLILSKKLEEDAFFFNLDKLNHSYQCFNIPLEYVEHYQQKSELDTSELHFFYISDLDSYGVIQVPKLLLYPENRLYLTQKNEEYVDLLSKLTDNRLGFHSIDVKYGHSLENSKYVEADAHNITAFDLKIIEKEILRLEEEEENYYTYSIVCYENPSDILLEPVNNPDRELYYSEAHICGNFYYSGYFLHGSYNHKFSKDACILFMEETKKYYVVYINYIVFTG